MATGKHEEPDTIWDGTPCSDCGQPLRVVERFGVAMQPDGAGGSEVRRVTETGRPFELARFECQGDERHPWDSWISYEFGAPQFALRRGAKRRSAD